MKCSCFAFALKHVQHVRSFATKIKIKNTKCNYLNDSEWNKKLVGVLNKSYSLDKSVICLNKLGNNDATETFLSSNVNHVIVWTNDETFRANLKDLQGIYPEKLTYVPSRYSGEFTKVLRRFNSLDVNTFLLFDSDQLGAAISHFLYEFFKNKSIWTIAPDIFILVNEDIYNSMFPRISLNHTKYLVGLTFCDLFFNYKAILEKENPTGKFFLLSLSLKDEVLKASKEVKLNMKKLVKMIRHFEKKRRSLCDGIGLNLIDEGIGMMDEIKDIPPHMWPKLYQMSISHPNYKHSNLEQILEDELQESSQIH